MGLRKSPGRESGVREKADGAFSEIWEVLEGVQSQSGQSRDVSSAAGSRLDHGRLRNTSLHHTLGFWRHHNLQGNTSGSGARPWPWRGLQSSAIHHQPPQHTETTAARLCPKPPLCSPSHLQTIQAGLPFPPPSQSMEGFSPSCSRRVVTSWLGHWMTPTRGDGDGFGNSSDGGWGRFPLVFIPSVVPSLC